MDNMNGVGSPIPVRQRLALTRALLSELDPLDVDLDLVVPDRESVALGDAAADFLAVGGGLRVQLKLNWDGADRDALALSTDDRLLKIAQHLLGSSPDVDAVIVATPPSPFPSLVVDAYASGTSIATPSGTARDLPSARAFGSVREALRQLIAPPDVDWSGLPTEPLVSSEGKLSEIVDIDAVAHVEAREVRESGRRAHGDAKKISWQAVSESDQEWTAQLVRMVLAGRFDVGALSAQLDERAEAGERS